MFWTQHVLGLKLRYPDLVLSGELQNVKTLLSALKIENNRKVDLVNMIVEKRNEAKGKEEPSLDLKD